MKIILDLTAREASFLLDCIGWSITEDEIDQEGIIKKVCASMREQGVKSESEKEK